jgi:hypothetical protein
MDFHQVFQEPFDESDWGSFDAYAQRVKQLTLSATKDDNVIPPITYFLLSQRRPWVLPGLEELKCPTIHPTQNSIFFLLSPTLKHLELGGPEIMFEELIDPMLVTVVSASERSRLNLTSLILHGKPSTNFLRSILKLSNIHHISISAEIDLQSFKEMGLLPNLENLNITLPTSPALPPGEIGFTQLRTLHITSPFSSLQSVLQGVLTINMEFITITAICPVPALTPTSASKGSGQMMKKGKKSQVREKVYDSWAECFMILHSKWSSTLQSITIDQDESLHSFDNPFPSDLFSTPSCYERLSHLQFLRCRFTPYDTGIHSLALACPNLTRLHLPLGVVTPAPSPPKFEPLGVFETGPPICADSDPLAFDKPLEPAETLSWGEPTAYANPVLQSWLPQVGSPDAAILKFSVPKEPATANHTEHVISTTSATSERVTWGVDDIQSSQSHTTTTIAALWSLAELCPSLSHLQIGLDVMTIPPFFDDHVHSHGLIHLSVGSHHTTNVPSKDILKIARHIDRMFPRLEDVQVHDRYSSVLWGEVQHMMSVYKTIRMDEGMRRLKQSLAKSTRRRIDSSAV